MYDEVDAAAKSDVTEEAEKQIAVKNEVPKLEIAAKLAENTKTIAPKEGEDGEEKAPDGENKESEAPPIKAFKAKFGQDDVEIPEEATLVQKINGKDVSFKVADAVAAFIKKEEFNRQMDSRVTTVTKREKAFADDQKFFKDTILNDVIGAAQSGDFVKTINKLAKLAAGNSGMDVVKFEKAYFSQLDKIREVYTSMTPEQQAKWFAEREAQNLREELNSRNERDQIEQSKGQLQSHIKTLTEKNGIPEGVFWESYKYIVDNAVGEGKHFKSSNDITPEDVTKFTLQAKHDAKVYIAGQKLGIDNEEILSEVSKLTVDHPEYSPEDIASIIERSGIASKAPNSVIENLNRKAGKQNQAQRSQVTSKKKNTDGLDEEDMNFLYRQQPRAYKPAFR